MTYITVTADDLATTRKALGISQDELASDTGVSRTTISMIEQGNRGLSKELQEKIEAVFTLRVMHIKGYLNSLEK